MAARREAYSKVSGKAVGVIGKTSSNVSRTLNYRQPNNRRP
jgi:hypothetical protein